MLEQPSSYRAIATHYNPSWKRFPKTPVLALNPLTYNVYLIYKADEP